MKIKKAKTFNVLSNEILQKDLVDNKIIIESRNFGASGCDTIKDFRIFAEQERLKYMPIEEALEKALNWYDKYAIEKINDFNVYICLGENGYTKKPETNEIKKINNGIVQRNEIYSYTEFKDKAGNKGYPFCCGIFSNLDGSNWIRRIKNNFCWQEIWALDFDDEINFDDFMQRATNYNIEPNFVYKTFSCKDEEINKFRAVWIADFACTHTTIAESVGKLLMTIFPEADPACKDASRIFFGGKGIVYENPWGYLARLDFMKLISAVHQYIDDTNSKHRLEKMREISKNTKICLKNGLLDVKLITIPNSKFLKIDKRKIGLENSRMQWGYTMDFSSNTYRELLDENVLQDEESIYILVRKLNKTFNQWYVLRTNWSDTKANVIVKQEKINIKNEKGKYIAKSKYENTFKRKRERGIKKNDIAEKCKLCKELFEDEYLSFLQLFGVCTNLINIENGLTLFKESLEKSKHNIGRNTNWQVHSDIVNKQELYAMKCVNFCPYSSECKHGNNIIQTVKTKRNTVVVIDKPKLISLEEGQERLNDIVKGIFKNE